MLVVATRYRGQRTAAGRARYFVLEVIKHVDYLATANGVVRTAFLYAALVGLGVALILGVALSSRLLRRLRLLRDASRSLDEPDLTHARRAEDTVSDEIGELAQAFATMHERLRQQEDARRAFVATASHELRTPLASLDGMLELLAEDLSVDPIDLVDARERVARARVQSRRLAGLATDLLDLSRIDAQLDLRSEPVELVETARAVTAEFDLRAHEREVAIVLDESERPRLGAGRSRQRRAHHPDHARQRAAAAPPHSMVEVRVAQRHRPADDRGRRRGAGRAPRRARADLRALPARQRARHRGRLRPRPGDRLRARGADGRPARADRRGSPAPRSA